MFCLCLGLPCVFRQGFRAVLFCQNQSGGFRYGESECGGFHGFFHALVRPLPVQYNPFRLWDDGKLKNFTVQPGVRYWMRETYGRGCFIGLHGVFSIYNAGGLFGHRYRYEGTAFGGGLSAGLVRPLSRRWNLEFELGLGVVWADWERYRCVNCGKRTGKGSGVYVTPTRTAVNLVYLF